MIIDCHVHLGKLQTFHTEGAIEELICVADKHGIDKLFCTDAMALFYDSFEGNKRLARFMRKYPQHLLGYCTISSARYGQEAVDEVRRCVEEYGMQGLKIYSFSQPGTHRPFLSVDDPWMDPILEKAVDYGIPVLAHANPMECASLCKRFPELILIMAHSGNTLHASGDWHRAIAAAKENPHLLLDTSTSSTDIDFIETAVEELGAEKILYGSDWPIFSMSFALARVQEADILDMAKTMMLGDNLERIMGKKI